MFPNDAQKHPSQAASLPPVSADPQQAQPQPAAARQQVPSVGAAQHYAAQARQVITQYANDPYRMSEALTQLKSAYLSEQYQITPSKPGN